MELVHYALGSGQLGLSLVRSAAQAVVLGDDRGVLIVKEVDVIERQLILVVRFHETSGHHPVALLLGAALQRLFDVLHVLPEELGVNELVHVIHVIFCRRVIAVVDARRFHLSFFLVA